MISEMNINMFRMINDLGKEDSVLNPIMIFIAEYLVIFLALAMMIYWFTGNRKNRVMVGCAMLTFIFAELIGKIAGEIHFNKQPFAELENVNQLIDKAVNNSFPSNHTMVFFSVCVTFWLFQRGWGFLWLIAAVLVGISRIWVGVHYPADVLTGAAISIVTASILYKTVPKFSVTQKIIDVYEKGEDQVFTFMKKKKDEQRKDM